ncbi:hypothetical protein [Halorussus sp. AFM4]|uniref:hypothetical protein n=1 Tax=Halorussus sp. AFM4 TaxID=3421651 RepID=UPI003EC122A8
MKRRQLLRLGGLALTVPLVGCASIGEPEKESEFTFTKTGEIPVEVRTSEYARSYPGQEPFAEVVLGENSQTPGNLYGVEVYNDSRSLVEISLTTNRESDDGALVLEGEGAISNGEYMVVAISRPATYINTLEISGTGVDLQKTFEVPQSAWNAAPKENEGIGPEHNIHINKDEIDVRFVGEEK